MLQKNKVINFTEVRVVNMSKGSRPRPFSVTQAEYDSRWDAIFGKDLKEESMTPSVKQMKQGTCGCGRSPTGDCIGWHSLSQAEFEKRLAEWQEKTLDNA
jgi:hypothetical protein